MENKNYVNLRKSLKDIWSMCDNNGIHDSISIIEVIAQILLADIELNADRRNYDIYHENRISQEIDKALREVDLREGEIIINRIQDKRTLYEIVRAINDAAVQAGGKAIFFDQFVLFYPDFDANSGRFPTPRHVVQTMQRL